MTITIEQIREILTQMNPFLRWAFTENQKGRIDAWAIRQCLVLTLEMMAGWAREEGVTQQHIDKFDAEVKANGQIMFDEMLQRFAK